MLLIMDSGFRVGVITFIFAVAGIALVVFVSLTASVVVNLIVAPLISICIFLVSTRNDAAMVGGLIGLIASFLGIIIFWIVR